MKESADIRKELTEVIESCAHELIAHGVDSIWADGQLVCNARITIEIDEELIPRITYSKEVIPA